METSPCSLSERVSCQLKRLEKNGFFDKPFCNPHINCSEILRDVPGAVVDGDITLHVDTSSGKPKLEAKDTVCDRSYGRKLYPANDEIDPVTLQLAAIVAPRENLHAGALTHVLDRSEFADASCSSAYVDLSHQNIHDCRTVSVIPEQTVHLNLAHNWIATVPLNFFVPLTRLSCLDFSFNKLKDVNFWLPPSLKILILRNNEIASPPSYLGTLEYLWWLDLSHNPCTRAAGAVKTLVSAIPSLRALWFHVSPDPRYLTATAKHSHGHEEAVMGSPPDALYVDGSLWPKKRAEACTATTAGENHSTPPRPPVKTACRSPLQCTVGNPNFLDSFQNQDSEACPTPSDKNGVSQWVSLKKEIALKDELLQSALRASATLSEKLCDLEEQHLQCGSSLEALQKELYSSQRAHERLSGQVFAWQKMATDAASKLSKLQSESTELREQLNRVEARHAKELEVLQDAARRRLEEVQRIVDEDSKRKEQELATIRKEHEDFKRERTQIDTELKQHVEKLQTSGRELNQKLWDCVLEKREVEGALARSRLQEEAHTREIEELKAQIQFWRDKATTTSSELAVFQKKQFDAAECLKTTQQELAASQVRLTELSTHWVPRREFACKVHENQELSTEMAAQRERLNRALEQQALAKLEVEELRAALESAETRRSEAMITAELKSQQLRDVNNELETLKGTLSTRTRECLEAQKKLTDFNGDLAVVEQLKKDLEAEKQARAEAEAKIDLVVKEKEAREKTFRYLREQIDSLENDLLAQRTTLQKAVEEKEKRRLDFAVKKQEGLQKDLELMSERSKAYAQENEKLKRDLANADILLQQRDNEMRLLLREMEAVQAAHQDKLQRVEDFFKSVVAS